MDILGDAFRSIPTGESSKGRKAGVNGASAHPALDRLKRFRSRVNPALVKAADALIAYQGGSRLGVNQTQLRKKAYEEWNAVLQDVRIREELNQ